ncbi:beta-glucosidase [Colletotrichum abscissum]|uniref:beta-glucosidase n=1 Tax=Colletotrichum abscissum TaxID=1671311 RepID=UPI0027D6F9BA|nr:beta-glucosidase [Colletotrichum abscissum]KAK1501095.1 beta-glucosidase [Colletotrichum abscissum]
MMFDGLLLYAITAAATVIQSDAHFYGESPPVYPAHAYGKAKALIAEMSLDEKVTYQAERSLPWRRVPHQRRERGFRAWYNILTSDLKTGADSIIAVGPLGRVALGGRNWEVFSNDPYLCGSLAAETITGIQEQGVMASVKHFIGNEQETNRRPLEGSEPPVEAVSSNIDDKTLHELYLCKLLNGVLKTELGFQGFTVSDWDAQRVASALAGLDMAMPGSVYWGANLTTAIQNGSVPESRLDDMATRGPHKRINARDPNAVPVLFQGATEGHVLVKNLDALPLKGPQVVSVFGYSATTYQAWGPVQGMDMLKWLLGQTNANLTELLLASRSQDLRSSAIAMNGTIFTGGGSGSTTPGWIYSPLDALTQRAMKDGTDLLWDTVSPAPSVSESDACLVFINAWATETLDRSALYDDYSDGLVNSVADQCSNTIVVIHNAGIRLVDGFVDHPNVTAIIYAHLPGQSSGEATIALLYGDENFSGKLPYTVARQPSDYGDLLDPDLPEGSFTLFPQSDFDEGTTIDYRAFDAFNITPRYEFGFGMSYTTFEYADLSISCRDGLSHDEYPSGPIEQGGHLDLWDNLGDVQFRIKNTGGVAGQEISQLYLDGTDSLKHLRGFEKVALEPGQTETVTLSLTRRDLSEWDTVSQNWKLRTGRIRLWVGASSRDIRLEGFLEL